jgi:TRAP-type C4-dicarboxylate transport system permease small subunit
MTGLLRWLRARAEDIGSALLGLMFLSFVVQIVFRYVLNLPLGWTLEACLTFWLWAVFWGAAFTVRDHDHVKFDVLYWALDRPVRRVLAFVSAAAIVAAFAISLPATFDYVTFYKIKSSATLGIRLDLVFSVYLVFAVSMIVQYGLICWRILSGRPFEFKVGFQSDLDEQKRAR